MCEHARTSRWCHVEVDPVEQIIERALLDQHRGRAVRTGRDPERLLVEPLVEQAESRAVEEDALEGRSSLAEEHEQRAAARAPPQLVCHDAGEPLKSPPQVDRLQPDEHLHAMRDHWAPPIPSAPNTT